MKNTNKLFGMNLNRDRRSKVPLLMTIILGVMLIGAFALSFTACEEPGSEPEDGDPPAAAISSSPVTVTATKANAGGNGHQAANATVTINLSNATVNNALSAANASAWFNQTVAGLTYNANAAAGASAITITIAGTPTATSSANATISIPAGVVKNTKGKPSTAALAASGNIKYSIGEADPDAPAPPSAAISGSVTVTATKANASGSGGVAANATVTINLTNATVNSALSAANASAWFSPAVAGLTYTANAAVDASVITITIASIPTEISSTSASISIPAGVVKDTEGTATTAALAASGNIIYDIDEADPDAPAPPSAAISGSVTVTATKANAGGSGGVAANATVTINLSNATVNTALAATNASAWFSPAVAGLTYTANAAAGAGAITITIGGIPTASSSDNATISISAGVIKDSEGTPSTTALAASGNITYNIGEAAPDTPPSAAISGSPVTVTATKANASGSGGVAANATVTINLSNATVNSALSATNASAWFSPAVAGLTYTANAAAGAGAITITIGGIPTASSSDNATISISAGVIKNTGGTPTTAALLVSGNITYNIGEASASNDPRPASPETMSGKTALRFFIDNDIKAGWNLGNSMDAVEVPAAASETAWGNPLATQALFNGVKESGFDIVRIGCTWIGHIGSAPDYTLSEERLRRIAEVVGYAKTAGIKAMIINIHHDGNTAEGRTPGTWGFVNMPDALSSPARKTEIQNQISAVWTQIAEYFQNYGDYLIFETLNEVHSGKWGYNENWNTNPTTAYQNQQDILFDWNQAALSAIRATGGNNATRFVAVPGLGSTEPDIVVAAHSRGKLLPNDGANGTNKLIVSVHYYAPSNYTVADATQGQAEGGLIHTWGDPAEKNKLNHEMELLKTNFFDNNIAVYIGESGAPTNVRRNMSQTIKETHLDYISSVATAARANGAILINWDDNGDFKMLERSNGRPQAGLWADVLSAMMTAINSTTFGEGSGDNGGGDPTPNPISGNMGNYNFGTQENGVDPNYTQAVWNLTGTNLTTAKATGAKLVLVLNTAPSATMQLVWQGPTNEIWWKQADILGNTGNVLNVGNTTWNAGTNTLTINLADALDDYSSFTAQPSLNIIIAYYGGSNINDLGIVSANLETD